MKSAPTEKQKKLLEVIYRYIKDSGYPPTFEEMRQEFGVKSNQSVVDFLDKLEKHGLIRKDSGSARSLAILPLGYQFIGKDRLTPFLGVTTAGLPLTPTEIDGQWESISPEVAKLADEIFLLKVKGDSMINAGIDDGSTVLVKNAKEFFTGEIVLADVAGDFTIKRFISEDKPPYLYLKPENPKYNIIYFTDEVNLKGKVISILSGGQWKTIN